MRKLFPILLAMICLGTVAPSAPAVPPPPGFGVAAHDNVSIEWWYVNAHVTTEKGRHLALIGSFFRFGNGHGLFDPTAAQPRAHYLIYAVTDLDKKAQRSYSLADGNMVALLQQVAPLLAATNPSDKGAQALLASLKNGKLPAPSRQIAGPASIVNSPFHIAYGVDNTLTATDAKDTAFTLDLGGGKDKIHLTLSSRKPAMAVGGKGETGLTKPTDMYYYSLTRCAVGGTIDTGTGPEKITGGQGWFDHQWGNSWVAQNDGWDWWGVQLDDGTDILFFRQRDLSTGKVFFPLATFMDKNGHQSVTRKIIFTPDKHSLWKSARTGVTYPLGWFVSFPEKHLTLHITTSVKNQEMPILGPGSGIWEGACDVAVLTPDSAHSYTTTPKLDPIKDRYKFSYTYTHVNPWKMTGHGVAYMELVGYNSPAVKRQNYSRLY